MLKWRSAYYTYIMSSRSSTLYVGVTNDLERRAGEHREGTGSRCTARYGLAELVYCEEFIDIRDAIEREKQIKRMSRAKKIALIEQINPGWRNRAKSD